MSFQKWIVQIEVDDSLVADGFNLDKGHLFAMMYHLGSGTVGDIKVKIIHHPEVKVIRKLQGFAPTVTGKKRKKAPATDIPSDITTFVPTIAKR